MFQALEIEERENHEKDAGYNSKKIEEEKTTNTEKAGETKRSSLFQWRKFIYHFVILIIGIVLFVIPFTSDYVYYACSAAVMVGVALSFVGIIKQYNIISTHKMPQLEARGGDENA